MIYDDEGTLKRMYSDRPKVQQIIVESCLTLVMRLAQHFENTKPVRMLEACLAILREDRL